MFAMPIRTMFWARYPHYLFYKTRLIKKIKLQLRQCKDHPERNQTRSKSQPTKMNTLNKLIENSVREHYEKPTNTDEQGSQLSESSNAENNFNKNNQQANGLPDGKAEKRKRKKDDESTDEEELPRRRAITMGQHKRRKRFVTKYQKELEMERKDEQFRAEVFSQEYSDSLKDFVVNETSVIEGDETSQPEPTDVYTTSSFFKNNSTFLDDEAEENDSEIEVKDDCSDSEEERMYLQSCGRQNFYEEREYSSDEDFEELSDDSEDFKRRVRRKRNQFVFEEVEEEDGESVGSRTDDDLEDEDNGSDLESFIADDHEPTILEESDEEEPTGLDSSLFYSKKKKRNRVLRFDDSDDDDEIEKTATVKSSKCVSLSEANDSVQSVLPNTTLKPEPPQNLPKKETDQQPSLNSPHSPKNVPDQPTITLDSSLLSKSLANELAINEDDGSSDEIRKKSRKSNTMIIDSSSDEAGVTDILSSEEETERIETSPEKTDQEFAEQSIQLDNSKVSKVSACKDENSHMPKFSSDEDSDSDSLNHKKPKRSNARKVITSDDDDDSIECVFSENEDSDGFELNEEDLDGTLIEN